MTTQYHTATDCTQATLDRYLRKLQLRSGQQYFDTGDIFLLGVPACPDDASLALDGLSSRMARLTTTDAKSKDLATQEEITSLEELGAMLMVLRIPTILGWQVDSDHKSAFAILIGKVWHGKEKWLMHWIARMEMSETITPESITAQLLTAPLEEFECENPPYAKTLATRLSRKAEWYVEKENRKTSLDKPISGSEFENEEGTTLLDVIHDPDADQAIVRKMDYAYTLDKLSGILSPQEKAATMKFRNGEKLSRTENRAMNRGLERMKKYCKEHEHKVPILTSLFK